MSSLNKNSMQNKAPKFRGFILSNWDLSIRLNINNVGRGLAPAALNVTNFL